MMSLDLLIQEIEDQCDVHPEVSSRAFEIVNGDRYVHVSYALGTRSFNEDAAQALMECMLDSIKKVIEEAAEDRPLLIWRRLPTFVADENGAVKLVMRLAIGKEDNASRFVPFTRVDEGEQIAYLRGVIE